MRKIKNFGLIILSAIALSLSSCEKEEPQLYKICWICWNSGINSKECTDVFEYDDKLYYNHISHEGVGEIIIVDERYLRITYDNDTLPILFKYFH